MYAVTHANTQILYYNKYQQGISAAQSNQTWLKQARVSLPSTKRRRRRRRCVRLKWHVFKLDWILFSLVTQTPTIMHIDTLETRMNPFICSRCMGAFHSTP